MKDKKNIIIAILSVLVVVLLVLLAYNLGLNAGQRSPLATNTNPTTESSTLPQETQDAQPTAVPDSGENTQDGSQEASSETSVGSTFDDRQSTEESKSQESTSDANQESAADQFQETQPATEKPAESTPAPTEKPTATEKPAATEQPVTTEKPSATQQPSGDSSQTAHTEGIVLEISNDDTWGESPKYYRMNILMTNNSDKPINGWEARINVGEGAAIDSGWRGQFSLENGALVIKNEEHNAKVPKGGSIDFGLIISNISGDLSYTVQASKETAATNGSQGNGDSGYALDVPAPTTNDWLYVKGNKIVDSEGKEVWITGVNWFGYNTGTNIFDGIWNSDLNTSIQGIADHGFNLIRIPISAELLLQWKNGEYPTANFNRATNYYLEDMNSLEIFDYVIGQCRANGLKIMIDIHSAKTDASGHNHNMWYKDNITTEKFQEALVWMAERYANDDTIIAYDLKNEPHGKPNETDRAIWNDSTDKNNWKYIAEQTALMILEKNPNVLIMVEGTEIYPMDIQSNGDFSSTDSKDYHFNWWGGNLRGVADYPIDLGKYQNKLVYSPHDYGPTVYQQPWFYEGYNFDSLYEDCWRDNWMYIYEDGTAPLLIGEWGGFMRDPNLTWMTHMRTLSSKNKLHHTFWCFNANSGDTGGLVLDDFKTWDEEKYAFVKEVLWQENGKFVGLDHDIPLGTAGNGITLSEAKGLK